MAKLSTATRKALPKKEFALPDKKFPIEDKAHAVAAEKLVGRAEKAGNITPAQAATVKAKAKAKLGKKDPGMDSSMDSYQHHGVTHTSKDR